MAGVVFVGAVALAGCMSAPVAERQPNPPAEPDTTTASAAPTPPVTSVAPPTAKPAAPAPPLVASPAVTPQPGPCRAADISPLSTNDRLLEPHDPNAPDKPIIGAVDVRLRNTTTGTCTLQGRITVLADPNLVVTELPGPTSLTSLAPYEDGVFTIKIESCLTQSGVAVRVLLPADRTPIDLGRFPACNPTRIGVTPIGTTL